MPKALKLQPFEQKVLDDAAELAKQITALKKFSTSPAIAKLDDHYRNLVAVQLDLMGQLRHILAQRINQFHYPKGLEL